MADPKKGTDFGCAMNVRRLPFSIEVWDTKHGIGAQLYANKSVMAAMRDGDSPVPLACEYIDLERVGNPIFAHDPGCSLLGPLVKAKLEIDAAIEGLLRTRGVE